MKKNINLKEYVSSKKGFYFCKTDLFQFGKPDETILIVRSSKKCDQKIEDFIIQSLLTMCCEDNYMKEEYIDITDKRLVDLEKFLFSFEVGAKEKINLNPIEKDKGVNLLHEWLSENDLKRIDISLNEIEYFVFVDKYDSMEQNIIFEDNKFRYFLSRGLG